MLPRSPRCSRPLTTPGSGRCCPATELLDEGVYASVSDIGDAENISKGYVSRILRLALLAPDIIEAILGGGANQSLMLQQLEGPLPVTWLEQRGMLVRRPRAAPTMLAEVTRSADLSRNAFMSRSREEVGAKTKRAQPWRLPNEPPQLRRFKASQPEG